MTCSARHSRIFQSFQSKNKFFNSSFDPQQIQTKVLSLLSVTKKMFLKSFLLCLLSSYAMASLVISPREPGVTNPYHNYLRFADMIVCNVVVDQWIQVGSCSFMDYCNTSNKIQVIPADGKDCKIYTDDPSFVISSIKVHRSMPAYTAQVNSTANSESEVIGVYDERVTGGRVCGPEAEVCHFTTIASLYSWCYVSYPPDPSPLCEV